VKSERSAKVLGLLLFVVLIGWVLYMSAASGRRELDNEIKLITVTGNALLNENEYLAFANLDKDEYLKNMTLPVIKLRLEKHPYVKRADVELSKNNEVHININEKTIKAVLSNGNKVFLATDEFEVLPFFQSARIADIPMITNLSNDMLLEKNEILKTPGLVEAFKIMDAAEMTNEEISKKLSEINLRYGGDIILLFSGIKPPVILGRGNTAKKICEFNELLNGDNFDKESAMNSAYIDLRFNNEIFLGDVVNTGLEE